MKKLSLVIMIVFLLSSCASASVQPTTTSTATSTETSTSSPTNTPQPTSTPRPTATLTPPLPETIEFTFDDSIPKVIKDNIKVVVDEAYWFYAGLGCPPDGFKTRFYVGDGGYANYKRGVEVEAGIPEPDKLSSPVTTAISHEIAHGMCQIAFTKKANMGAIDLRWLTEGVANYFSAMEQIKNTGMNSGVRFSNITQHDRGMAQFVSNNFCAIPLDKLEPANAHEIYSDSFYAVGDVATRLLVKTTPVGIQAIVKYYTLLATVRKDEAFEQAFGRPKEMFYEQYKDECIKNFPTLTK